MRLPDLRPLFVGSIFASVSVGALANMKALRGVDPADSAFRKAMRLCFIRVGSRGLHKPRRWQRR
eukprot:5979556-Amphidinium_carterae.1